MTSILKKKLESPQQLKKSLKDLINKAPLKLTEANIFKEETKIVLKRGSKNKKVNVKNKKGNEQRSLLLPLNIEYYPEKVKRQGPAKKVVLHPKHDYKVVATTNKRKRRIPLKGCQPTIKTSQPDLMTSVDLEMDDEDLMEILTCPSPVWWEDPPEEMYYQVYEDEEYEAMIYSNRIKRKSTDKQAKTDPKRNKLSIKKPNPDRSKGALKNDINFFKKFVEKRSKLENVLGNIKKRSCEDKDNDDKNEISVNTNEIKKDVHVIDKNDFINNGNKQRKDSSSGCSDISINEEELLNTLENIEIPVQKTHPDIEKKIIINNVKLIVKNDDTVKRRSGRVRKPKKHFYDINESKKIDKIRLEIPNDLPPLTKKPFRNVQIKPICSSPKSIDSETHVVEFDSISDSNVKFLDEYDEKADCDTNEITVTKEKNGDDLVTIYRIIPQKVDSDDIEDQIKANLVNKTPEKTNNEIVFNIDKSPKQNAEKKGKRAILNNKKVVSVKNIKGKSVNMNQKSLLVANKCVNYCHSCSSVFETETCQYCKKKT